jgi:hypothetical protein
MDASKWLVRLIEAAVITVTLAAICQELEKPREERLWHGKVGFIPYDFRFPSTTRIKERWWNEYTDKVFTPATWGIGWSINLFAILEKMRFIGEYYVTEDDFLMPTPTLKKILENRPAIN